MTGILVIALVAAGCVAAAVVMARVLGATLGDQRGRPDFRLRHRRNRDRR